MRAGQQNRASTHIDPAVIDRVDRILEERNATGVPYDIAMRLLDDMHLVACQMRSWSCATYWRYGMHAQCHQTEHEPDSRSAS